ncbi:MAG: biotin/lipoyl-binding protein [Phycisphaera sp. RhM]|nr:biotin/lipoyl-binding protein [Phycisphaera sp. RhM]
MVVNRHRNRTGAQRVDRRRVIDALPGVVTLTRRGHAIWINFHGGIGRAARVTLVHTWLMLVLPLPTIWADDPQVVGPLVIKLIDQVEVPALEPGPIESLEVRLGDTVKAGQVIARIDDRISDAQRELAATALATVGSDRANTATTRSPKRSPTRRKPFCSNNDCWPRSRPKNRSVRFACRLPRKRKRWPRTNGRVRSVRVNNSPTASPIPSWKTCG